ncbi:hypothetical protein [Sphingomonas beigongshangi]|uniref:hypothetical protein n=1 Tax=Sphingomonas beigongshangi TaxID=2782540 RepID=UPI00193B2B63|nr:hypothetical protein [Sphingomonas beigongshangi]
MNAVSFLRRTERDARPAPGYRERMDEATRYTIVYGIIGLLLLIGIPSLTVYLRRRRREKLRRRGIKTYGH